MPGVKENTARAPIYHAFFPECAKPYSSIAFLFSCSQLVRYFPRVYGSHIAERCSPDALFA